jgi:hypothetical protein
MREEEEESSGAGNVHLSYYKLNITDGFTKKI